MACCCIHVRCPFPQRCVLAAPRTLKCRTAFLQRRNRAEHTGHSYTASPSPPSSALCSSSPCGSGGAASGRAQRREKPRGGRRARGRAHARVTSASTAALTSDAAPPSAARSSNPRAQTLKPVGRHEAQRAREQEHPPCARLACRGGPGKRSSARNGLHAACVLAGVRHEREKSAGGGVAPEQQVGRWSECITSCCACRVRECELPPQADCARCVRL